MTVYEAIGQVATALDVNYIYGSATEIQKRLIEQSKDVEIRDSRYPLIALFTPIGGKWSLDYTEYECDIVFVTNTQQNYTTPQRLELIYKETLYPLVENFFAEIKKVKSCSVDFEAGYEVTDAFFYSSTPAQEQNTFAGYLDAVEIKKLKIKIFKTCT